MHVPRPALWVAFAACRGPNPEPPAAAPAPLHADVVGVSARDAGAGWVFSVTVSSPDTGCARYADWWEVVRPDGSLLYRRILQHSHPDEQPFTRSGEAVEIDAATEVIVRAHLQGAGGTGYGGAAMSGSPGGGFRAAASLPDGFAEGLASAPPLPTGCQF